MTMLNHFAEARAADEEAQQKKLDSPSLHFTLYQLAFLQNDTPAMAQQVVWAADKAGVEDLMLCYEAYRAAYSGRLIQALEISDKAAASARASGEKDPDQRWQSAHDVSSELSIMYASARLG
jgi:hypothetical protein